MMMFYRIALSFSVLSIIIVSTVSTGDGIKSFDHTNQAQFDFRTTLRNKLQMANDAVKYGPRFDTTAETTESSSEKMKNFDESLSMSSAELGASNEVIIDDATRSIFGLDKPQFDQQPQMISTSSISSDNQRKFDKNDTNRRFKALVQTKHSFEYRPIRMERLEEAPEPKIIEVEARSLPLEIHFRSTASRIKMVQTHQKNNLQQSEDRIETNEEPQRLIHLVRKPIIQEVREIITPYRRIVQDIRPVIEEIHSIISHREESPNGSNSDRTQSSSREMEDLTSQRKLERIAAKPQNEFEKRENFPKHPKEEQKSKFNQSEMISSAQHYSTQTSMKDSDQKSKNENRTMKAIYGEVPNQFPITNQLEFNQRAYSQRKNPIESSEMDSHHQHSIPTQQELERNFVNEQRTDSMIEPARLTLMKSPKNLNQIYYYNQNKLDYGNENRDIYQNADSLQNYQTIKANPQTQAQYRNQFVRPFRNLRNKFLHRPYSSLGLMNLQYSSKH